jgi:hypothetical protein
MKEKLLPVDAPKAVRPATRIHVEKYDLDLILTYRWFRWRALPGFALFAYFAAGALFQDWIIFRQMDEDAALSEAILTLFPYGLATIVLLIGAYCSLAFLINRTTIRATSEEVLVQHGPLPWTGNREFGIRELRRIFTTDCDQPSGWPRKEWLDLRDCVFVELHDRSQHALLRRLRPHEADFIAQTLIARLGVRLSPSSIQY